MDIFKASLIFILQDFLFWICPSPTHFALEYFKNIVDSDGV